MKLTIPEDYKPLLDELTTEAAIRNIKELFQNNLSAALNLRRVTAPLCVVSGTGLNDDLNGVEHPVSFVVGDADKKQVEIVHSLAKWKRVKLAKLDMKPGNGIYTDMNAIRADEELDNIHSIYVDQWDWEKVVSPEDRNLEYLKKSVRAIYEALKKTEKDICALNPTLKPFLVDEITFVHSEDAEAEYPELSAKEREDALCKKYGAVFLIGIGGALPISGKPHDGRAPDYDDWLTPSDATHKGLNGDILIYNPVLKRSFEISSMGIRVNKESLLKQLEIRGEQKRLELCFHKMMMEDKLPLTMGGGIGQSRLCMLFLQKAHIGEIQASIWPTEMVQKCKDNNIPLL